MPLVLSLGCCQRIHKMQRRWFTKVRPQQIECKCLLFSFVGVDYRMAWQGTRWMIYDVLVERTSLVRNYRAQFESVIKKSSYEELVRKIRGKLSWPASAFTADSSARCDRPVR